MSETDWNQLINFMEFRKEKGTYEEYTRARKVLTNAITALQSRCEKAEKELERANQIGDGIADCLRLRSNIRQTPTNEKLVKLWDEHRDRLEKGK